METNLHILKQTVTNLLAAPKSTATGQYNGVGYRATTGISDFERKITDHYADFIPEDLASVCRQAGMTFDFPSFGLIVEFEKPVQTTLYDDEHVLDINAKEAITRFGTLIFRNAYLTEKFRNQGQRNIFPDLHFHLDRGSNQDNQYSLFCRDPFDAVQKHPRQSSTLITANIIAYLQSQKEGRAPKQGQQALYKDLFKNEDLSTQIGNTILEQAWTAPEGTGEICLIDNRLVLHASYYRGGQGYPIGVRYLF